VNLSPDHQSSLRDIGLGFLTVAGGFTLVGNTSTFRLDHFGNVLLNESHIRLLPRLDAGIVLDCREISDFHRRCDGHKNTAVLILDTDRNTFGGFTELKRCELNDCLVRARAIELRLKIEMEQIDVRSDGN
jgi:hypothetical protein